MQINNCLLLGRPLVGKTEQQRRLVEKLTGQKHKCTVSVIETGDIFRNMSQQSFSKGHFLYTLQNKFLAMNEGSNIDKGNLSPDEFAQKVVVRMYNNQKTSKNHWRIWNGFPRTVAQAVWWENFLTSKGEKISAVILMDMTRDDIRERLVLLNRMRADDDKFDHRQDVYEEHTAPIFPWAEERKLPVSVIAGRQSPLVISGDVLYSLVRYD